MRRDLFIFAVAVALAAALYAFANGIDLKFGLIVLVGCTPLLARLLAPVVLKFFPHLVRHARQTAHGPWQGKYYNYDGWQLRFFLVDETVWLAEEDIANILSPATTERERRLLGEHYGKVPGQKFRGFTEVGMGRLLNSRTNSRHATREMIRFKFWLETETYPNIRRLPESAA